MKLKDGLVLRKIAGKYMVMPIGRLSRICKPLHISSSAAFIWKIMEQGEFTEDDLVEAGLKEYDDVSDEVLRRDVRSFMKMLDENYMLESGRPEPILGRVKIEMSEEEMKRLQEQQENRKHE